MGLIATVAKTLLGTGAGALFLGYLGIIKPLQYYGRYAIYVVLVIICALYGVGISIVCTLVGKQGISQYLVARAFAFLCRLVLNIDFHVLNSDIMMTRPAVYVGNHQSLLDLGFLGAAFAPFSSVTAKKSLKYYPFLGWFMTLSGSIFIDRHNRTKAISVFDGAKKTMIKKRQNVWMFPEGTRSNSLVPTMAPFKKGAFHLAIQAGVPIVPVVCQNYSKIMSTKKKIFKKGKVDILLLDPIDTSGLTPADVDKLLARTHEIMNQAAVQLGYSQPSE